LVFAALAEAYRKSGNYEGAFQVLRDGIKNHPLYKFAYFTLAHCYFDVNQYQLAYTTLRPFVANERENFRVQNLFAETCLKLGQTEEALESLKYCLFLAPKNHEMAKKIKEIEQSISPTVETINEIAPKAETPNTPVNTQFEVKNLNPVGSKEIDIDEWKQVDLSHNASTEHVDAIEQVGNDWKMDLAPDLKPPERDEVPSNQTSNAPIITHTLVDLYCAQGLYQKGIEILQKILELNPTDHKSRARLQVLRESVAVSSTGAIPQQKQDVHLRLESFLRALKDRARQIDKEIN
ncbi:MAG: CDC27 family protein, partial [Bdellovibrionota bacterium]